MLCYFYIIFRTNKHKTTRQQYEPEKPQKRILYDCLYTFPPHVYVKYNNTVRGFKNKICINVVFKKVSAARTYTRKSAIYYIYCLNKLFEIQDQRTDLKIINNCNSTFQMKLQAGNCLFPFTTSYFYVHRLVYNDDLAMQKLTI